MSLTAKIKDWFGDVHHTGLQAASQGKQGSEVLKHGIEKGVYSVAQSTYHYLQPILHNLSGRILFKNRELPEFKSIETRYGEREPLERKADESEIKYRTRQINKGYLHVGYAAWKANSIALDTCFRVGGYITAAPLKFAIKAGKDVGRTVGYVGKAYLGVMKGIWNKI